MVKKRLSSLTFFCNWREHFVFHVAIYNLQSNQFLHNLQFTEEEQCVKEHTLVRFLCMEYLWNKKHDPIHWFQRVKGNVCFYQKWKHIWGKTIESNSCLTRGYLRTKIETIWTFKPCNKSWFLFNFCRCPPNSPIILQTDVCMFRKFVKSA